MRLRRVLIVIGVCALAATACGDETTQVGSGRGIDGVWQLVEVDGEPIVVGENTADIPYVTLDGGSIRAELGCNRGGGDFIAGDDFIDFDNFFAEAAGCIPDTLMFAELALTDAAFGRAALTLDGDRMQWDSANDARRLLFRRVDAPPTTTLAAAPRRNSTDGLDCGNEYVTEDLRVDGTGVEPLEMAQRYAAEVVAVSSPQPLWWAGENADGAVVVLVLGHDDGTDDYQILFCEP